MRLRALTGTSVEGTRAGVATLVHTKSLRSPTPRSSTVCKLVFAALERPNAAGTIALGAHSWEAVRGDDVVDCVPNVSLWKESGAKSETDETRTRVQLPSPRISGQWCTECP